MTVGAQYIFQSPYSSSVQVGRPDPSVKKEETQTSDLPSMTNKTQEDAQAFEASQVSEVKPSVESAQLLDVYA